MGKNEEHAHNENAGHAHHEHVSEKKHNSFPNTWVVLSILLAFLLIVQGINFYSQSSIASSVARIDAFAVSANPNSKIVNTAVVNSSQQAKINEISARVLPKGKPSVYADELGVSYDKVVDSLNILVQFDDLQKTPKTILFSDLPKDKQQRYMKIGTSISCEYCCGAKTLIDKKGQAACGCSHSAAMRGLAKYLLQKHSELSDEQILKELANWKALFFPKDTIEKELKIAAQSGEIDQKALEQSGAAAPQMVGGC